MSHYVAFILCAGYGTRMGALTERTPKPLLPVAGKPILDYLVDQLVGFERLETIHVVSNRRYLDAFKEWATARSGAQGTPELTVHDDGSTSNADRRGAVGDLDFVLRRSGVPAGALIAAGDNIFQFSLEPFWNAFVGGEHSQVLGLEERDPDKLRKTGVLELASDGRVRRLHEKPSEPPSRWACPSFYGLRASALAEVGSYLAAGHPRDEIGRFVAHLVRIQTVQAWRTSGRRLHVGSPAALSRAEEILEAM